MKALAILAAGSLVANAVFVAVLLKRTAPLIPSSPSSTSVSAVPAEATVSPPPPPDRAMAKSSVEVRSETDFHQLAAQLRSAGFSEDVVRNAVANVIAHHFKDRRRALGLEQGHDVTEFWKSAVTMGASGTPEQIAGRRALEREQREMFRSLFGPDYDVSEDDRRRRAHGLPEETAEKLHKIFADYRDMEEQARDDASGTSEMRAKLDLLVKEKRADIERLLTPEQLLDFDLRMGVGSPLLNRLGAFQTTEAEFRALYSAQKAFNEANPSIPPRERNGQFEPELRRVLGEARYAELLTANERRDRQSRAFVEMRSFVMTQNLAPSVASEVLTVQAQYQPQLNLVRQNPSLNAEQKAETRAIIAAAARQELLRVLGPDAFEAYQKTKGGWLPPPVVPPAPAPANASTP